MLIACPDCGAKVSDRAPTCVQCGRPIAALTIEATGKLWKAVQLVGALIVLASFPACLLMPAASVLVFLVGTLIFAGGRVSAWWYHG